MKLSLHPIGRLVISFSASLLSIAALADARPIASGAQSHPGAVRTSPVRRGGEVRIVAPSGGDFTTIQAAVNASAPGDTVLVKTGHYTTLTIDGKGINVVADTGASVQIHSSYSLVQNVPAGQVAAITGIERARFRFLGNAGAIRIDGCVAGVQGGGSAELAGCRVVGTADLALTRTTLWGDQGTSTLGVDAGKGLEAFSSAVTMYLSPCIGGAGGDATSPDALWGTTGGDGMTTTGASSFVFAAGCQFVGGDGGDGFCDGVVFAGNGGHGVRAVGSAGTSIGLESTTTGGAGGAGCPPGLAGSDGTFTTVLPGSARYMQLATPMRDASVTPISFVGEPGDVVSLFISRNTAHVYDADLRGVRMVDGPYSAILYMGIVPPSGTLNSILRLDDRWTPPHTATLYFAQAVFADTGGGATLSNPVPLVVLDSVY